MRILIADDDYVSRKKLQALLSAYGDCDTADDGEQALEMFRKAYLHSEGYGLITLDIDMPGLNGHEVLKTIREYVPQIKEYIQGKEPKILMVTSMKSQTDFKYSFQEGCEGYLRKPIRPQNLEDVLTKVGIRKLQTTRELKKLISTYRQSKL